YLEWFSNLATMARVKIPTTRLPMILASDAAQGQHHLRLVQEALLLVVPSVALGLWPQQRPESAVRFAHHANRLHLQGRRKMPLRQGRLHWLDTVAPVTRPS